MFTAISIFILLICVVLSLVVLVQDSKGGGLTAGLSSSSQIMGVRKTTDMLEKLTWGFAIALFVLSFMGSILLPKGESKIGIQNSFMQEQIQNAQNPGAGGVPQQPVQQPAQQQGGQPQSSPPPAGN